MPSLRQSHLLNKISPLPASAWNGHNHDKRHQFQYPVEWLRGWISDAAKKTGLRINCTELDLRNAKRGTTTRAQFPGSRVDLSVGIKRRKKALEMYDENDL
jgi:hypothetical protein